MYRWVTGGFGRWAHFVKDSETQKKSKFQFHPRKKFFYEKLYFCIKTWRSGLRIAKKWILRPKKGKNPIFKHFRLDAPISRSLLWLTYTSDFAPNRLKLSGIAKQKMSENFVKLALTVWQICPEKWQGDKEEVQVDKKKQEKYCLKHWQYVIGPACLVLQDYRA